MRQPSSYTQPIEDTSSPDITYVEVICDIPALERGDFVAVAHNFVIGAKTARAVPNDVPLRSSAFRQAAAPRRGLPAGADEFGETFDAPPPRPAQRQRQRQRRTPVSREVQEGRAALTPARIMSVIEAHREPIGARHIADELGLARQDRALRTYVSVVLHSLLVAGQVTAHGDRNQRLYSLAAETVAAHA